MQAFGVSPRVGYNSDDFYNRNLYKNTSRKKDGCCYSENKIPKSKINQIYHKSSENMDDLPDNSIHLMVTSPPYNVGKDYDDDLTAYQYREKLKAVWKEVYRVLVPGGRVCINIANLGRTPYIPLNSIITTDMLDIGFLMRGEIIWNKSASAGTSCAWGSWRSPSNPVLMDIHEYIMVFCKDSYKRIKKNSHATINKDDFLQNTKSIWNIPAESAKRVGHPTPYPVELPERFIHLYTYLEDVVLDPFMGSGTTAVAAKNNGRYFIGYETLEEYITQANNRISTLS